MTLIATSSPRTAPSLAATAILVGATLMGSYYLLRQQQQRRREEEENGAGDLDNNDENGRRKRAMEDVPLREINLYGDSNGTGAEDDKIRILTRNTITIAHASVTGTCYKFSQELLETFQKRYSSMSVQLGRIDDWDWWDELLNNEDGNTIDEDTPGPIVVVVLPTHTNGAWPVAAETLQTALHELLTDWRIERAPLKSSQLSIACFGMGSSAYGDQTMGKPAKECWTRMRNLGANTLGGVGIGDDSVGNHSIESFAMWKKNVISHLDDLNGLTPISLTTTTAEKSGCGCGKPSEKEGCCQNNESHQDSCNHHEDEVQEDEEEDEENTDGREPEVMDLEDMGASMMASSAETSGEPQEMVTPSQAKSLQKEGYKLIGTHSAVKLCRWTKHQLRGRGGCYKHTFYGITSYQCMEATPSLACANKCVFCWRHHKNPVGKEWRWKMDDPYEIVDEAVKAHVKMIKETKGIPGVKMDRWREAHTVRHCALSLVGEPIMYPRIDEFLGDLHTRKISTFLVTNGQHPQAIQNIRPITQLYVSVDAPTQKSLIEIDRPLFSDAWDRLRQSLELLKDKGQRTVARLTVVKGWNSDEIEGYAELVALGKVSLVEVKGVTFCGKSDASNLNMSNSPWHHEVVDLVKNLRTELQRIRQKAIDRGDTDILPEYDLACEHKHSCSVLLARVDQFAVDDPVTGQRKWRTWIDYDKFQELACQNEADPTFTFQVKDYLADTPTWALFGAAEEGFDPTDTRHRKKKKHPKYTRFDEDGIPTHDHNNTALTGEERLSLRSLMEQKKTEVGCGTTVTELKSGEKRIEDASLMFRGMVVVK